MNDSINFGLRVKMYREQAGLSQAELANLLGYQTTSSIAKIETGKANAPRFKVYAFAKALGCNPEDLMPEIGSTVFDAYKQADQEFSDNVDAILKAESLQNILKMLSEMDTKQIIKVEKVIRTLSED